MQMVGTEPGDIGAIGQRGQRSVCRCRHIRAEAYAVAGLLQRHEVHRRVREYACGRGIGGQAVNLRRRAELRDAAFPQGRGIAAQKQSLLRFRSGINEDRAGFREDLRDLGAEFLAQFVVEVGEGLVQQHQRCALDQRAGQGAALLLAA